MAVRLGQLEFVNDEGDVDAGVAESGRSVSSTSAASLEGLSCGQRARPPAVPA
jgi:hypothetical protein